MIHHSRAVHRALKSAYIVTDLPFSSYESSPQQAFQSAAQLLRDGHAEAVKLEGGKEMAATISHLVGVGIPVMGHVGLMPQRAKALGGFRVQGNTAVKVAPPTSSPTRGRSQLTARPKKCLKMPWLCRMPGPFRWYWKRCLPKLPRLLRMS